MKEAINQAIQILKDGGVILYPTDTIWGLGCDATNPEAVEKIYKIKRRSDSKSLVVLAADIDMVSKYVAEMPEMATTLVEITDKPLTIIYPEGVGLAHNVTAEDGSVAIRVPMNDFCTSLLKKFQKPIVSTSANISGERPPIHLNEVSKEISAAVDWVANSEWDKGATGKASSIIFLKGDGEVKVIRE